MLKSKSLSKGYHTKQLSSMFEKLNFIYMKHFNFLIIFLLGTGVFAQETILGAWEFTEGSTNATTMNIPNATATSLGFTKNGDQSTAPEGSVNVSGRAGFSGNFLTGMAITSSDLTGGKLHISISFNSLDFSSSDGVGKYQFYLKGDGPADANGHRFIGFILEGLSDGSGISIKQTVFNSGDKYGVGKQVGILSNSLVANNPITLGTTMDFINNSTSFWVNSPGEYTANPWGLTTATTTHDGNQSNVWGVNAIAEKDNIVFKQLQFNIVSKDGTLNLDQLKISTGDYQNTLSTELLEKNTLKIYPNPADNHINVFNIGEFDTINIYNISGRKVLSVSPDIKSIDVSSLNPGLYILESGNTFSKFLKK
jgi:hypothetical protein